MTFEAHTSVQNIAVGNGRAIENHSLFASRQALSLWHVRYSSMTVWHLVRSLPKLLWLITNSDTIAAAHGYKRKPLTLLGEHKSTPLERMQRFRDAGRRAIATPSESNGAHSTCMELFPTNAWICMECARTICLNLFE